MADSLATVATTRPSTRTAESCPRDKTERLVLLPLAMPGGHECPVCFGSYNGNEKRPKVTTGCPEHIHSIEMILLV